MTRTQSPKVDWYKGLWFPGATPKYFVMTWITIHNRLAIGDKISKWSPTSDAQYVLCMAHVETRDHLYFSCPYSQWIWMNLTKNLLGSRYTTDWNTILERLVEDRRSGDQAVLLRYVFQTTIHIVWRERNGRKHGERHQTSESLSSYIDKVVRNRISSLRLHGSQRYGETMQAWFMARA